MSKDDELTKLGVDSLDLVEIIMEIEEELGIEFETEEMFEFKTIKNVLEAIEKKFA